MLTAAKPAGRYYLLRDRESGKTLALVRALTQAGAVSHYVVDSIAASLPTQDELLALGADPTVRRLDALAYRRDE